MSKELSAQDLPIEVSDDGNTRVLKVGDLTINIDLTAPIGEYESTPGILFNLDRFLARLAVFFDNAGDDKTFRDGFLRMRVLFAEKPEFMQFLRKLCESCIVIDPRDWVLIEKTKWDVYLKDLERIGHHVDPNNSELYVGDNAE